MRCGYVVLRCVALWLCSVVLCCVVLGKKSSANGFSFAIEKVQMKTTPNKSCYRLLSFTHLFPFLFLALDQPQRYTTQT